MKAMRELFCETRTNLLGVTIRYVKADSESLLSYAPREEAFAVIVYINEVLSPNGRVRTKTFIQRLTHLALQHEGTFYLTYARDVEFDDLRRAYPHIETFLREKHNLDPENRFTSWFFELYKHQSLSREPSKSRGAVRAAT
jgi:hypothetical protein